MTAVRGGGGEREEADWRAQRRRGGQERADWRCRRGGAGRAAARPCRRRPHDCALWCQAGGGGRRATVRAAMGAGTEPAEARRDAAEG